MGVTIKYTLYMEGKNNVFQRHLFKKVEKTGSAVD